MGFFSKKEDIRYKVARERVDNLILKINNQPAPLDIDQNTVIHVYPGKKNSPVVMSMGKDKFLIYYPQNSIPYHHKIEGKEKMVQILDGCIYDETTGKKYIEGEKFVIKSNQDFIPITKDCECYVRVLLNSENNIWDNLCEV
jgi:hypothetical protein